MSIFDMYADKSKHDDLSAMFTFAAQNHKDALAANFIEKDVWVTEILRLLYDEKLLGDCSVAFKGGTALSKCWSAIERFSEDIDLSIHWADLSTSLAQLEVNTIINLIIFYWSLEEETEVNQLNLLI